MAKRAELFSLPSPYVLRITDEKGKQEYIFARTRVGAEQEARIQTGQEPEIITDLKEMFPHRPVKKLK